MPQYGKATRTRMRSYTAFGHYVNARSLRDISWVLSSTETISTRHANIGPELEARRVKLIGDSDLQ